jgi:hypothetical protein
MVKISDELLDHPYELLVVETSGPVVMVANVVSLHVAVISPLGIGVADSDQSVVSLSSEHVVSYVAVAFGGG